MNLVVAVDERWGIGKDGGLLTHLPKDLGRFQRLTTGNIVVMGRKTLESLPGGKPLPDRETWVLTRDKNFVMDGVKSFASIEAMMAYITEMNIDDDRIFVSGGAVVYNSFIPLVKKAYITKLKRDFNADVFMDNVDASPYLALEYVSETFERKGLEYEFTTYGKAE